jgi:hypothetical protein
MQQVYYCAIFELAIHAFDIKSGWRYAFERHREYTRRDLFMGKLNLEKFSQRLQDMNKAIPPEWTVNVLALGKKPWRFKYLDDQLNMYHQQWQADKQNQIIAKMTGKMPVNSNDGNRKNNEINNHNSNGGGRSGGRQGNNGRGGRGGHGRGQGGAAEEEIAIAII